MKHLLIIEDDAVDQMAFERFAKKKDFPYTYQVVNSISDAKKALKVNTYDGVVSDYFLGDGTTFEILELKLDIPIIVVTGTGSEEIAVDALKKGAFDYLIKDVDGYYLRMLPITIKNALHRFEVEKENKEYHANLELLVESRTVELNKEIETRKQTEIELIKLNEAVNLSPVSTFITDTEGNINYTNSAFTDLTGYTNQEILGKKPNVLKSGKHPIAFYENLWKTILAGKIWHGEFHNKKKNGKLFWELASISPLFDKQNKIINYIKVSEDITERKKAEEEYIKSAKKYQKLKESKLKIPDFNIVTSFIIVSVIFLIAEITVTFIINKFLNLSENIELIVDIILGLILVSPAINYLLLKPLRIHIELRHQTEKELRESEKKYKSLINQMNDGLMIVDNDDKITFVNEKLCEMLEYTADELINTEVIRLVPEDSTKNFVKKRLERKKGKADHYDLKMLTKSSKTLWMHISGAPVYDINGQITSAMATMQDVTEVYKNNQIKQVIYDITKKAGETLNLETLFNFIRQELGKLVNTSNFYIALYDKDTDIISTPYMADEKDMDNSFPKGKTLTGYLIDKKKSFLASENELNNLKRLNKIDALGPSSKCWLGVPLIIENKCIGAIVLQSYTDENAYTKKDVALIELIASNISQVIKQLQNFEKINLLNQALIQSPVSVVITNPNGDIEYVNPTFTNLSGYSNKEAIGNNLRILKSGEQSVQYYENLWNSILSGQIWEGGFVNKHKDGSKYLVEAIISPVKNKNEKITHFIAIEQDVTQKRKLERDFIHAFVDAQEQEKQSFGEDLHDGISQILTAESMYIDILLKLNDNKNHQFTEHLTKVKELNSSAIHDTRGIAHGLMSKQLKERGLLKAVEIICEDYNNSRNIEFIFENNNIKEVEISKEIKIQLYRITQEISTNIIRHSGATRAMITLKKVKLNQLELFIKDNGVGMNIGKIKKEKKGAGLKNIERRVKLLNGEIKIDTKIDKCTCYTIVVPLISLY